MVYVQDTLLVSIRISSAPHLLMHGILIQQILCLTEVYKGLRFKTSEIYWCYQTPRFCCFIRFLISISYSLKILRKAFVIREMEYD